VSRDGQTRASVSETAASARPLSVLIVNSLYAPFVVGGAEVVTEMLARALAAQSHRVSVATSCSRDQDFSVERRDGVDVYRYFPKNRWWLYERFEPGNQRSAIDKLRWRVTDGWNRDAGEKFSRILDRVRPDVVHTHNIKGFSPVIWHIARQNGIPVIHTAHSYELICADGSLLGRSGESCAPRSRCMVCKVHGAWYRRQAAAIDVFCSPSDYLLRAHMEAGVVPKRSAHVRNGVTRRGLPPRSAQLSEDRLVRYLYMGQLAAHKGIDILIGAIRLTSGSAFTIDIAGRGDGEARLTALAGVDDRVRFHGFVEGERKDRLLSNADVLIFPSIWVENAPMSIAEAFCYGLPVIGSRIGAIPEFVEHGTNGLLFEAGNAASLAACMMELSERPDELRRVKQGASRSGNSWPTAETMALDYVGIYRSLLQGKVGKNHASYLLSHNTRA
jgi:glycosyltransferase involved in cell wall biosynthesis